MTGQAYRIWKPVALLGAVCVVLMVSYRISNEHQIPGSTRVFRDAEINSKLQLKQTQLGTVGQVPKYKSVRKELFVEGQDDLNFLRANSYADELKDIDIDALTADQLKLTLHSYLDNFDIACRRKIRMGDIDDGGWEVCDDPEVRPRPPCLVYSLGTGKDWTFDEDVSRLYGCHVIAVDPSLDLDRHDRTPLIHFYPWGIASFTGKNGKGWQMYTLSDLKAKLGHQNRTIDILKMDVESAEWTSVPEMITSGQLNGVKQLYIEYHVTGVENERKGLKFIKALELGGWRRYFARKNLHCRRKQKLFPVERTSCYEVMYMII